MTGTPMRSIRINRHTLMVWEANTCAPTGQAQLRYELVAPTGAILFEGADYGVSPMHGIDSDAALLGLLAFLTLKPGDTDKEYFAAYTPDQMDFATSTEAEAISCDVSVAEESRSECTCILWENLDDWTCPDAPAVLDFNVIDHGEDGSQYFPGCGTGNYDHVATGVGDTALEALEDALETMAQQDHEFSCLQALIMRDSYLSQPSDRSAHAELEPHDCDKDPCDWHHYVSVQYDVRED